MNHRKLGKTGVEISEVGFGTWQLGGISWVAPKDQECISLLRRAFDSGINLFDVSPSYGNDRLKEKGMTRFVGVSLEAQPEEALIALHQGIDILQIRFNLLFPEAKRIFATVADKGVGLLINSPFGHGYLTGRYRCYEDINEGDYPKGSFRASKPRELVEGMIGKANAFRALDQRGDVSATHAAMKFILAHDQVSSVIPGHRTLRELEDNLAATNGTPLSRPQLQRVDKIFDEIFNPSHTWKKMDQPVEAGFVEPRMATL